jgi:hypothetical protein
MPRLLLLLLLPFHATAAAGGCGAGLTLATDGATCLAVQCSGNGVPRGGGGGGGGACACDPGWGAPDCSQLQLAPVDPAEGRNGLANRSSSWGGSVLRDAATGLHHLYYSRFELGCGLMVWGNNSVCAHATSASPAGPFVDAGLALPLWCHGPKAALLPGGGGLVLFHIGAANDSAARACDCAAAGGSEAGCSELPPPTLVDPGDGRGYITYATAPGFGGPWAPLGRAVLEPRGGKEGWLSNPSAPAFAPGASGAYFLAYRAWGPSSAPGGKAEYIFVARAAALGAPLLRVTSASIGAGEDPSLFFDPRGGLHLLSHLGCGHGHSFSPPGSNFSAWAVMPHAVGCDITWTNGTAATLSRRERPQLLFDASGRPQVLFSGVQRWPRAQTDESFTMAQRVIV